MPHACSAIDRSVNCLSMLRAEVRRGHDLRHRAGQLPHLRVELDPGVVGRVAPQLPGAIRPSAASATAMIEVFSVNTARSALTDEVAESQVAPGLPSGSVVAPVPVWNSP